ncbi:hypothetical protein [Roseomonas gilardii]|uniref:hypothetical protein n=1 Tax=Roseomonas gilardii TaxID=257708 RepID=UPI00211556EC|nr:hypothetical protein [Roseomonas gilardii]
MDAPDRTPGFAARLWLYLLGVALILAGLFLGGGGAYLIRLGGSWYFALAGLALLASGLLVAMRRPAGAWIFGLVVLASIPWALWEAGLDFWALVSRLFALGVGGCWWPSPIPCCCGPRAAAAGGAPSRWRACWPLPWSPRRSAPSPRNR